MTYYRTALTLGGVLAQAAASRGSVDALESPSRTFSAAAEVGLSQMFGEADVNGDGFVDPAEFDAFMRRHIQAEHAHNLIELHRDAFDDESGIPHQHRRMVAAIEEQTSLFWSSVVNAGAMIVVTELGDKTFFIAAILAMRHDRLTVFMGAAVALYVMTALSAIVGFALPAVLPKEYTHWASVVLFVYFGVRLLVEGSQLFMKGEGTGASGELQEVEDELGSNRAGPGRPAGAAVRATGALSAGLLMEAFLLTFTAEWGDRSQIATIALATAKDPFGVTLGGCAGHSLCTGVAVVGGKLLAARISERGVLVCGGLLFVVFAVHGALSGSS